MARPSGVTAVIPAITSPAPPSAWAVSWARSKALGSASGEVKVASGGTTTRLRSSSAASFSGRNMGGTAAAPAGSAPPANAASTAATNPGSRARRFP